ncbi:MAG TPA: pyruvate, phosphate dikinase [Candidatus Limnocylindrales bacterium]|nr:pyruvate, phosphate dikinase [Candidatus Limnocylindrales bacterium]
MPYVYDSDQAHGRSAAEVTALLGGKAANLAVMAHDLGLPVPPAFTVSTEACRAYLADGWPAALDDELRRHMARIEEQVGRRFGDPADPLLVSVRSGAPVSMPGMMDTILNLGLTDTTAAGLAAASGDAGFAASCRDRFESMYRDIVGEATVPQDPWAQLRGAIEAVFRSWNSDRARAYREREGIPDDLGTGVTVQAMVFGNRSSDSATGVLFTRNPATGADEPYGDVLFRAQGEDVVAGTHATEPIAVLDERLPGVARALRAAASRLERHHRDLCDIEFTIERGRLWLLQCRIGKRSPQAALRIAVDMAEAPDFPLTRAEAVERVRAFLADPPTVAASPVHRRVPLVVGLPASPGTASGEIVVTPEAAIAAAAAARPAILVRAETSPDDVRGMAASVGIVTATGGLASHAAVVARGWGIPAVVGAAGMTVGPAWIEVDGRRLEAGSPISLDGQSGEVFEGVVERPVVDAPEVAILRGWARELGIEVPGPRPREARTPSPALELPPTPAPAAGVGMAPTTAISRDDALVALRVKGYASVDSLATGLCVPPAVASSVLADLVADGLAEQAADAYRLTADGKVAAQAAVERSVARWGRERAGAALEEFVVLDRRMKEAVTAWQVRTVDGQEVLNDHADPVHDARVLGELGALHTAASAWLAGLATAAPRLAAYAARLDRANAAAQAGDTRYVASPRVDSYHAAWFELHEDLILHAGRTRAAEVAAGRA